MGANMNIKCKVKMVRKLFPKSPLKVGDFGILIMRVIEEIDGEPLKDEKGCIVVKGNLCEMNSSTVYTIVAVGEKNEKYDNVTYKLDYIGSEIDLDNENDKAVFLQTILTEKQYQSLTNAIDDPCEVIKNKDIEKLICVNGIGRATAEKLIEKYYENIEYAKVIVQLNKYGLTNLMVQKLIAHYGSPEIVVNVIQNDIYQIADEVEGIGFLKCDEIALKGGLSPNNPKRLEAYIKFKLREQGEMGNSWQYVQKIMNQLAQDLSCYDISLMQEALKSLLDNEVIWANPDRTIIALNKYYKLELAIAKELKRISSAPNMFKYDNWEEIIADVEEVQGFAYTHEQKAGIKTVLDSPLSVVTGLAGTGKTAITNGMISVLKDYDIRQCALSGRAAQRMKESNGLESNTIHKTLEMDMRGAFFNEDNQLDIDVLILDEGSMVSGDLFLKLLKAIKTGTKLVIAGDKGQLPAIGNCNVFFDLLKMGVPTVELTIVHRQAQASAIISKSIDIRKQRQLFDSDYVGNKILGELRDLEINIHSTSYMLRKAINTQYRNQLAIADNDLLRVQIVVPIRQKGDICTYNLNKDIQSYVHGTKKRGIQSVSHIFYEGDKVINVKNKVVFTPEGESINIFNGNIGLIESIDHEEQTMIVNFVGIGRVILKKNLIDTNLDLAYAITCHKLQGSSAERVIVACDFSAYVLLNAEWLYTAITRAERYCVLVAENAAVRYAISKVETNTKQTFLQFIPSLAHWEAA